MNPMISSLATLFALSLIAKPDLNSVELTFDLKKTEHVVDTSLFFGTNHWPATPELKAKFLPNLRKHGIRIIRGDLNLAPLVSKANLPGQRDLLEVPQRAGIHRLMGLEADEMGG